MPTVSSQCVFILLSSLITRANCSSDINECQSLADACHKDAYCSNYHGGYKCTCVSGYSGNGTVCIAPEKCQAQLDLIFLLDASGSVGEDNYVKEKEFIKTVTSRYELGTTSQAAVIAFSTNVFNAVPLGSKNTTLSFASAVDNIPYFNGHTRIDLALRLAYDKYFSSEDTNETQKLVILLTDGKQTHSYSYIPIEDTVQLLRSKAARIYAVTIGSNIDMRAMRAVTEEDDDIFQASEFNDLVAKADTISKTSCVDALQTQGITFCSIDPEMTNCEFPAHCVNMSTGVSCMCSDGYVGDPHQCEDVNECTDGSHDCPVNAYCVNIPGSYNCSCNQSGYSYNGSMSVAPEKCQAQLDLIFLLDASGSVGEDNYVKEKEFIKTVTSRYELGTTSQAAVIAFSTNVFNAVPLGSKNTTLSFASAVDNIPYFNGHTRIDLALRLAYDKYFSSEDTNETQKLVILLTDGKQTHSYSYIPIEDTVQLLRSKAARIYAVTIGSNIDMRAMRAVTEEDDDIFQASEFNDLVAKADTISKTSCVDALQTQGITFCSIDPEMTNCEFPAHCVNMSTGVSCMCSDGYVGDPHQCEDVNECTDGSHDCPVNAYCVNIPGSYNCSCNQSGYSYNGSMSVGM
ncbi:matrilin-2-like [Orbicella faveolata]|uniref:matrilin-2-like n=1 Tax=Orbicella faveolata TaxID=48498 RepID=UPI0009E2DD94|nr:matrilin-2-like [Orbicella faveolata]